MKFFQCKQDMGPAIDLLPKCFSLLLAVRAKKGIFLQKRGKIKSSMKRWHGSTVDYPDNQQYHRSSNQIRGINLIPSSVVVRR